jgi:hypothetical protein
MKALIICCRKDCDLLHVLEQNRIPFRRFYSCAEAIRKAPAGAGLMILADGYPSRPTKISPLCIRQAGKKRLRLYIEFPDAFPGIKIGKARSATVERAVVTSDFFGASLRKMRILAIHGLHFVPLSCDRTHIVAARVAGFDRAVFGLPKEVFPLMCEPLPRNLLVATTRLSHFVTGRFAPCDAWQTLWRRILSWLSNDAPMPRLLWSPMVQPSYGSKEKLPADAEQQSLQRGADWFLSSKLLLHHSRVRDANDAVVRSNNLMKTPAPDSPIGDGCLGILEGPLSVVCADGSQMHSVIRRGDCHAESAMALALGGTISGDQEKIEIARNLLDFYLFKSDARKRDRANPKHSAFGLIAWGIGVPLWYRGNFGDDNARLMMGAMATAAVLRETRWDKAVMLCLLANLRTAGSLGFRGDNIDIPELSRTPWQTLFNRRTVNYSPHMEAYLWACYLWAYERTGYKLFYERAHNAIRMTMETYTDGWRWMNGLAQDKARMILPLAWLVRVKNSREHRRWLDEAVKGLFALQEPCGAIREELGLPGRGVFPAPTSNEAYGTAEASLIQQNGDPVSDLLYTTNFAFLGLHEASCATGDPAIRKMEDKLAEFLCRIQIQSSKQLSLDGGWFRAFDFKRWEAWGSNSDSGWGAWTIESGWTQGWITSVLALRQLKTSFWDLTATSQIRAQLRNALRVMKMND